MPSSFDHNRGFIALIPVVLTGTSLLLLAVTSTQDAFNLLALVSYADQESQALAAARTCAVSALSRLPQQSVALDMLSLANDSSCRIDSVEQTSDTFQVTTSARFQKATVRIQTTAYHDEGRITRIISREI